MTTRAPSRRSSARPAGRPAAAPQVVDSSAWLEYLAGTERAQPFVAAIEDTARLVVPVVVLYEVFKKLRREQSEHVALLIAAQMQQGQVVDVDRTLALHAATLGMPLADSLVYATALSCGATLWTQDRAFEGLPNVRYFAK